MSTTARTRLRRSETSGPGISRRRQGRGFSYRWADGARVADPDVLARVEALVIPPAWTDVWICPWPGGHIQALGTDAAGRRQYRYHNEWRRRRDLDKHQRVLDFAARLPRVRAAVAEDLARPELDRTRVLATAVRLLDLGFFRVGGEQYAEDNGTYGLATMRKEHVHIDGDEVVFEYTAKYGKERVCSIVDPDVRDVIGTLRRRRGGGPELLAYREGRRWRDVRSADINARLHELAGMEITAKDFRTWHATVLMAVALAVSARASASPSARKRAVARAYREVSTYLGNTPAVCRSSYVDPRVVDHFADGVTIANALTKLGDGAGYGLATQGAVENAVRKLLRN